MWPKSSRFYNKASRNFGLVSSITHLPNDETPLVSVLVPARNEEANLLACLESLVRQQGTAFEVIVIDDHSTDATAEIARSFAGVRLITADPLPAGWCGKQHALDCGVRHARGQWLLFTDADTRHAPGSLARAVAEAQQQGADLLSYSPRQEVKTLWERAVMPVVFAELACTYRPSEVCDPASPAAAANGQYLLITREAYDAIGGHRAVRDSLLEDAAMARLVKQSGRRIRFRYAADAVSTRMYRSFGALCEGWTKNLALLFPNAKKLTARRFVESIVILSTAIVFAATGLVGSWSVAGIALIAFLAAYANFLRRILRAHFDFLATALAFCGLPIFSILLLNSGIYYASGRSIRWRGREYVPAPKNAVLGAEAPKSSERLNGRTEVVR